MMLYLHIPFCRSRCRYCDFCSWAGREDAIPEYLRALRREMRRWSEAWRYRLGSIYLGGGTPSLIAPEQIGELISEARGCFLVADDAEVTVEVNPATWSGDDMKRVVASGVNRLSVGVQSLRDPLLRMMGRAHDAGEARRAIMRARSSGAGSVSADLIYGMPRQSLREFGEDLQALIDAGVHHVSAYALTLEHSTPLARDIEKGALPAPDEDEVAAMYGTACDALAAAGYEHYEISNFAMPGHASRHNAGYWDRRPYLGLGPGAHSFQAPLRWRGASDLDAYLGDVDHGYKVERLDAATSRFEELMLGLRTAAGAPADCADQDALERLTEDGWLLRTGDRVRLTDSGMLLSSDLIASLCP
ncbi:MAG: radical SAM family heme chaperone HemW [Candidatus Geothermincolia bacterium]